MKRLKFILILFIGIVVFPLIRVNAQDNPKWELKADVENPVVAHGDRESWSANYIDPGAVIFHDGQFHMFPNGVRCWPCPVGIGYITSEDGVTWTSPVDEPIIDSRDVPFVRVAALSASVLVEEDGTWVMYLYAWGTPSSTVPWVIGRATAPDPAGPWTVDPDPVLSPGSDGSWDEWQVYVPSVVQTDEGYVMYYAGIDKGSHQMIGMATSEDGIYWTKYNDPTTTETPFAESDPVFVPSDGDVWDNGSVNQPNVVKTPEGWVMSYASGGMDRGEGWGVALSQDGIHWERLPEPILAQEAVGARALWVSELAYYDGTYYFFMEIQRGSLYESDLYLGTMNPAE